MSRLFLVMTILLSSYSAFASQRISPFHIRYSVDASQIQLHQKAVALFLQEIRREVIARSFVKILGCTQNNLPCFQQFIKRSSRYKAKRILYIMIRPGSEVYDMGQGKKRYFQLKVELIFAGSWWKEVIRIPLSCGAFSIRVLLAVWAKQLIKRSNVKKNKDVWHVCPKFMVSQFRVAQSGDEVLRFRQAAIRSFKKRFAQRVISPTTSLMEQFAGCSFSKQCEQKFARKKSVILLQFGAIKSEDHVSILMDYLYKKHKGVIQFLLKQKKHMAQKRCFENYVSMLVSVAWDDQAPGLFLRCGPYKPAKVVVHKPLLRIMGWTAVGVGLVLIGGSIGLAEYQRQSLQDYYDSLLAKQYSAPVGKQLAEVYEQSKVAHVPFVITGITGGVLTVVGVTAIVGYHVQKKEVIAPVAKISAKSTVLFQSP